MKGRAYASDVAEQRIPAKANRGLMLRQALPIVLVAGMRCESYNAKLLSRQIHRRMDTIVNMRTLYFDRNIVTQRLRTRCSSIRFRFCRGYHRLE